MEILFERELPTFARDILAERVGKVNKRAAKHGFPAVTLSESNVRVIDDPEFDHTKGIDGHYPIQCNGRCVVPQVELATFRIAATGRLAMAGWTLVGVVAADAVDAEGHAVPMVTTVPGQTFDGTITDAMLCEHCNTRRYRTETFILRHDDGREMQVGRQCIRDFLGHDPAALLAGFDAYGMLVPSDEEISGWGSSAARIWTVEDVIRSASRIVAVDGWYISKAKAEESENSDRPLTSTVSQTWIVLSPTKSKHDREFIAEHPFDEKAERIFNNTIEALANLKPNNEWEYKLDEFRSRNIAQVGPRHVGILASATILGLRLEERKAKAVAKPESKHIGTVGSKVTVEATVTFTREFDGSYGPTTLVKFSTADGDVQWWQSGSHTWEIGSTVTLTGTVKGHDADKFDGRPVTTLTRCKIGG